MPSDRNYWLDLFTGRTWDEFLNSGANVTGFRERRRATANKVHPGDYFVCYLTGLGRFIGVLEVTSEAYFDDKIRIWEGEAFPVRFRVKLVHRLTPRTSVPVLNMRNVLSIFDGLKNQKNWSGFFRGSPALFKKQDGERVVEEIRLAALNPVERDFQTSKYLRYPKSHASTALAAHVRDRRPVAHKASTTDTHETTHEEIQGLLLKLGSDMGLDVWVARNDRNRQYAGNSFANTPHLRKDLPRQFDEETNRTIELIDVLWLQKDAIVAAFEIEHTSSIYSGLLRMSDLISMQPNLKIDLYIVAPDERGDRVKAEVKRPTFARLNPPLPKICKLIRYSRLKKEVDQLGHRVRYMKPQFVDDIAESCESDK